MALLDLKYALSSGGPLLESGVRSKRAKREVLILELKNFKNREISFLRRDLVYCTYEQNVMAWPSHARQTSCTWACPRRPSSASSQSRVRQIHLRRGSLGADTRSVRCAVTTAAVAFLTRVFGRMTPIGFLFYFFPNIVQKCRI